MSRRAPGLDTSSPSALWWQVHNPLVGEGEGLMPCQRRRGRSRPEEQRGALCPRPHEGAGRDRGRLSGPETGGHDRAPTARCQRGLRARGRRAFRRSGAHASPRNSRVIAVSPFAMGAIAHSRECPSASLMRQRVRGRSLGPPGAAASSAAQRLRAQPRAFRERPQAHRVESRASASVPTHGIDGGEPVRPPVPPITGRREAPPFGGGQGWGPGS